MSIKIYTQNEKFYMEDLTNNTITELTEKVDDGKTLKLPENSANRKYCSVEKALKGITLDYKETKKFGPRENTSTSTPKTSTPFRGPKLNELVELLTEDERKIYKELMDKALDRYSKNAKRLELQRLREQAAALEAELNEEVEG